MEHDQEQNRHEIPANLLDHPQDIKGSNVALGEEVKGVVSGEKHNGDIAQGNHNDRTADLGVSKKGCLQAPDAGQAQQDDPDARHESRQIGDEEDIASLMFLFSKEVNRGDLETRGTENPSVID